MNDIQDLISLMRLMESDHTPDGWPAVKMGQITALCDRIGELESEVKRLAAGNAACTHSALDNCDCFGSEQPAQGEAVAHVVPGVMRCAKCEFRIQRVNLYVGNGTVGAGDNKTEPCPNGCGPLWPVTWEQEARECWKLLVQQHERMQAASAPSVPEGWKLVPDALASSPQHGEYSSGYVNGWNACRTAMLAAAPEAKP